MNQENIKLLRDPPASQRIQDNVSVPMRKYHSRKNSSAKRLSNINDQSSRMEKTEFKATEIDGMDQCIKENILYPDAQESKEPSEDAAKNQLLDERESLSHHQR